jgi:hypothetical protein
MSAKASFVANSPSFQLADDPLTGDSFDPVQNRLWQNSPD